MKKFMYKHGEWLVRCERCKFKRYASQVIKTWDGHYVCKPTVKQGCWDSRHPQDIARKLPKDDTSVQFIRKFEDTYTDVPFNCATATFVDLPASWFYNHGKINITKVRTRGPVDTTGTEVMVRCEWRVEA